MSNHEDARTQFDDSVNQDALFEEAEREVINKFLNQHYVALSRRHTTEDLIPLHVLNNNHHNAVLEVKGGRVAVARAMMQALDAFELSRDSEIQAVYRLFSFPVWALIRWKEDNPEDAIEWLHCALHACAELISRFGHNYLTGKRMHLAANIARVLVSVGMDAQALAHVAALRAVMDGDPGQWPYDAAEALVLPLEGVERIAIGSQLYRIEREALSRMAPESGPIETAVHTARDIARSGNPSLAPDPIRKSVSDAQIAGHLDGWHIEPFGDGKSLWSVYSPGSADGPESGFKIHVSASLSSAGEVLARAIPILTRMGVPFKHAPNLEKLSFLSSGKGGITQIGKFLTAYPANADVARELAQLLHEATEGLQGPRIASEPSIAPNSLVHYRYGGFSQQWLQLRTGRIVPARVDAGGGLEVDDRSKVSQTLMEGEAVPNGGDASQIPTSDHILRGRYIRVRELFRGPKGTTWIGFGKDMGDRDLLIIKEAYAYVMEGTDGLDARQRLSHEARCLKELGDTGITPVFVDYWEEERSAFLVYEMVDGPTFGKILNALSVEGLRPTPDIVTQWAALLCAAIAPLHERGYVVADIKPANLIFTGDSFRVIDLEITHEPTTNPTGGMGTQGYSSPQQFDPNAGLSYLDDVYSIGATMLAAATATDASMLPDPFAVARIEGRRRPGDRVYSAIERCLAAEPEKRFSSPQAILDYITAAPAAAADSEARPLIDPANFLDMACAIGDSLVRDAAGDDERAYWVSGHTIVGGLPARDLYAGSAGTALFLCDLYHATGTASYLDTAARCGKWLISTEPVARPENPMPGLYFGSCGPGLLYLKLHQLTGDAEWLSRAIAVSDDVDAMPWGSPDLMTGTAGTGLYNLALWRATGDESFLDRACRAADVLLEERSAASPLWPIPEGYDSLSGNEYIGFAHGSAGIGYFLAECCLARANSRFAAACTEIADWIIGLGRPSLSDGSGLTWGTTATDRQGLVAWCHGAAGIARFLLKAYEISGQPEHLLAAERAGYMLANAAVWNGTTQCHGLAGNLEVLIDIAQCTGSDDYLIAARQLGENLTVFRTERGWPSEERHVICPDFMVGQAGVGAAFIRLARPEWPHLISIPSFRAAGNAGPVTLARQASQLAEPS